MEFNIHPFESIEDAVQFYSENPKIVISANAEVLISNNELKYIVAKHGSHADGIGAVYYLRACGYTKAVKIAGADLWQELIKKCNTANVFLVGCTQAVINEVVNKLRFEYPNLRISGFRNGFLSPGESDQLVEEINGIKPSIVILAMGQPRQEILATKIFDKHPCLILCVGGALDVYAGILRRAPPWVISLHLEWLFRLIQQPSRFTRYLRLFLFFPFLLKTAIKRDR